MLTLGVTLVEPSINGKFLPARDSVCAAPIHPITAITISMAAAMNANTPVVPKLFRTPAIRNEVKIAEKRLQE